MSWQNPFKPLFRQKINTLIFGESFCKQKLYFWCRRLTAIEWRPILLSTDIFSHFLTQTTFLIAYNVKREIEFRTITRSFYSNACLSVLHLNDHYKIDFELNSYEVRWLTKLFNTIQHKIFFFLFKVIRHFTDI